MSKKDISAEERPAAEQELLFPELEEETSQVDLRHYRSYLASPFIAAALPLKDVKKTVFERKYNNISLKLTSDYKVPYGKFGRLLLSILTTHAVLEAKKDSTDPIVIRYDTMQQLLDELKLPKQRGKEIKEQIECFSGATFVFKEKRAKETQKYLFKEFYSEDEQTNLNDSIKATLNTTGIIPFFDAINYVDLEENGKEKKSVAFSIVLSNKFAKLSQEHAVPIDYTAYKGITSAVGKDLYAWFVYRNNSINEPLFISRKAMVDQFMPVKEGNSYESEERVNWNYIKEQINVIKAKYYKDLKVSISQNNDGITFSKSNPVIIENDVRYMLVTSSL